MEAGGLLQNTPHLILGHEVFTMTQLRFLEIIAVNLMAVQLDVLKIKQKQKDI